MIWKGRGSRRQGDLFVDERGVTTTGMVLSLLITLSLLFTAMQVYRVESVSAEVQDVADAAALAAENQVAEFMLVARFCDAVTLSLSLTSITVTGVGVVALCFPATKVLSTKLIEAGGRVAEIRNKFSKSAAKALNALQEALPYYAAACSVAVSSANNSNSEGSRYLGVAILVPTKGEKIEATRDKKAEKLAEKADEEQEEIREEAKEADDAAKEANECKERAFEADCGNQERSMYERAGKLAGLTGLSNPLYHSVDAWSFSVALERAKAYYECRRDNDKEDDPSASRQGQLNLRHNFYSYAANLLGRGYVHETSEYFTAYFPLVPKNTDEMRGTSLYTDRVYPVTEEVEEKTEKVPSEGGEGGAAGAVEEVTTTETHRYMHSYDGCPGITHGVAYHESVAYMEANNLEKCPVCGFDANRLGNIAYFTYIRDDGFERYYKTVAEEAERYEKEFKKAQEAKKAAQDDVGDLLEKLKEALKKATGTRIEPEPPGRYGAVALVVNVGSMKAAGMLDGVFVKFSGTLGPRAAISASTLVDEGSDEGRTALNSLLDGLKEDGNALAGAGGLLLDAWSWMLKAYSDGQNAITDFVEDGLNAMPVVGASGLGTWASGKLEDAVEAVGLQPVQTAALKPAVVNSAHVLASGKSAFSSGLIKVKQRVVAHPQAATDLFSAVMTDAERAALSQIDDLGDTIEIASIELLGESGPSIPVTIPIPEAARSQGKSIIQDIFDEVRSQHVKTMEVKPWE